MFSTLPKTTFDFFIHVFNLSANALNVKQSKIFLLGKELSLYHTISIFNSGEIEAFENIAGNEEHAGNQHFLSFQI